MNIILLLKPNKQEQNSSSYRPTSLLICIGKLLTKGIKQRLMLEIENALSYPFNLKSGTSQGSSLSLLLYIIFTADSMNSIPDHTEHGLFADDTAAAIQN